MKNLLEVCVIALALATTTVVAQDPTIPMQRGISVQLPATSNAVAVLSADKEDALVVAVTHDGRLYLGTDPISLADLADKLKSEVARRTDKKLYVKADARTPYANVIKVLDVVRTSGVQELALLTDQREPSEAGKLVTPTGLEMLVVSPR
ncbi:MAG: biopolymer transporter ExbD [Acidobacteria bacterium]|nr:biopolymer transporter ExbD [Acidobacteriota bacterium]